MIKAELETDESTSARLGKMPQRDTKIELQVRALVRALGHGYRICNRDLPGNPDLANKSKRWAIFVHGCFWHSHHRCKKATIPKRNREFWITKFRSNNNRDRGAVRELDALGFRVLTLWECELESAEPVVRQFLTR